ncbi:MAG: L-threonylcarbamoyladenylate synthase [Candidatus Woesearchaeota archaeon]
MQVFSKKDFEPGDAKTTFADSFFVYPTDTVYGLGCDATDEVMVKELRNIKRRHSNPFSVIVPSKKWIYDNCIVDQQAEEWLKRLPGPYTIILKLKNPNAIARSVNPASETIGVRFPDHWITELVAEFGKPIITTLVNPDGELLVSAQEDIVPEIRTRVSFMIDEGPRRGMPSTIVDLTIDLFTRERLDNPQQLQV